MVKYLMMLIYLSFIYFFVINAVGKLLIYKIYGLKNIPAQNIIESKYLEYIPDSGIF